MRIHSQARLVIVVLSAAVATTLGLGACAGGAGGGASGGAIRRNPDRIDLPELATVAEVDVLTAVRRLRPVWLRTSPRGDLPQVILDGNPLAGGPEVLEDIRASDVARLEYMSPSDATTLYGTGYPAGAIIVTTKR